MTPLARVTGRVAGELLRTADGPSAVAVAVDATSAEPVRVVRGHARTLDDDGRPTPPAALPAEPVFDLGSVTKVAATTALAMRLVDRERLDLDAPVSRWGVGLPGGADDTVTVRDLLEHRAGLWEWWPTYVDGARTADDVLALLRRLPLRYPPRTGRHYSDLGFVLLGEIVARAYDAPLDDAAAREVFDPLGMTGTGYRPRGTTTPPENVVATSVGDWYERRMVDHGSPYPVPRTSEGFAGWRTHTLLGEANDGNCWHALGGVAGHAGLFGTATDLLRFGRALLDSLDGHGPWSADVVRAFCRHGRDPAQGLGFRFTSRRSGPVVEHPGFPGARFAVLPHRHCVVVLLTNRLHTVGEPVTVQPAWELLLEAVEVR